MAWNRTERQNHKNPCLSRDNDKDGKCCSVYDGAILAGGQIYVRFLQTTRITQAPVIVTGYNDDIVLHIDISCRQNHTLGFTRAHLHVIIVGFWICLVKKHINISIGMIIGKHNRSSVI